MQDTSNLIKTQKTLDRITLRIELLKAMERVMISDEIPEEVYEQWSAIGVSECITEADYEWLSLCDTLYDNIVIEFCNHVKDNF